MRALVTGGGGFLGGAVVDALLARGDDVTSVARGDYPALRARGVATIRGDLADPAVARSAVEDVDVVFHVAARAGISGSAALFRRSNVDATRCLLDACRTAGVGRFVFTSTPSVVHGGDDIRGGDESLPYATHFDSPYPETKAEAERLVLAANSPSLAIVALRPHLVWGPGDTQLVPRILERARSGRLRLVGDGSAVIDTTYVDDAAQAHLDAADRLAPGAPCAGRPYFITSGDPRPVRDLVNGIVTAGGLEPISATVPLPVAVAAGAVVETVWKGLERFASVGDPPMTRFLARQLATDHWFDISAAKRDLGYAPQVPLDEGFARLGCALRAGEH
ncbi:NAD-dependent epimerase/dehydratase family protein [Actinomycetospora sp. NBRC 106378]|uniref:NAD-dependent epimerase/dehydratase family protein n=1 Tax=Actinomycetospora sp. NBRC 106378 TaxID=3032208 RepID=UPI0024A0D40B|nr:NAD-dependent epimerase/dehydratase family protein [Actinomycetospora sp. NBRC 106378]GLZ52948.1 3-beta hydroxysteroid dehydrogenase [Actinomycetospora sp. NBRC 106378]